MHIIISDEELNSLTTVILKRHGIDFTNYESKSLKRRMIRALSIFNIESVHELWIKILKEPDFIHPLVNELSVGLTSMFRDPRVWIRLRELIPRMLRQKEHLKVWHAGCSSGEEVYTFNILLEELGMADSVKSIATDINLAALKNAENGQYHTLKLSEYRHNYEKYNPSNQLENYYNIQNKYGQMDLNLVRNVRFYKNNLINDSVNEKFDIIFCRNVMIYFDNGAKKLVLDKFYNNLVDGGLLIIGYYDSLVSAIDKNKFEFFDLDKKIFRKFTSNHTIEMNEIIRRKLNLLVHLAEVDGDFHKSEKIFIDNLADEWGFNKNEFYLLGKNPSTDGITSIDDKSEMLYLVLKLIKADNEIKNDEVVFCRNLAAKLGYRSEIIDELLRKPIKDRKEFDEEIKQWMN